MSLKTAVATATAGIGITAGLEGTTQGVQLGWEFKKLAYEISDALLPVIKDFTHGMHVVNMSLHRMNQGGEAPVTRAMGFIAPEVPLIKSLIDWIHPSKEEAKKETPKEREHLTPIWQTHFGGIEELWKTLQAMSTENPAEEMAHKELGVLEAIFLVATNILLYMQGKETITVDQALEGKA